MASQARTLIIVPCGLAKIWDRYPETGSALARFAYTGAPFKVNCEYADHFAIRWVILSAKYGFLDPVGSETGRSHRETHPRMKHA